MFKFTAIIAAAALAVPAIAAETEHDAKVVHRNGEKLYCVKQPAATGTNVVQRVCRTQEEWAATGAKVLPKRGNDRLAANPQPTNHN